MNLFRDIRSRRWLITKGLLFLLLSLSASAVLLHENWSLQNLALLVIAIWAACRFYYFLFYVLEKYAGRQQRYAGVWDALVYLLKTMRNRDP